MFCMYVRVCALLFVNVSSCKRAAARGQQRVSMGASLGSAEVNPFLSFGSPGDLDKQVRRNNMTDPIGPPFHNERKHGRPAGTLAK